MAKYRIKGPDGNFYRITAPDGATDEQVQSFFKQEWPKILVQNDAITKDAENPTAEMSTFDKVRAGWGKSLSDIYQGTKQALGLEDQADVKETARLDAPLMKTGGGRYGHLAGTIANLAPTAMIPGANTTAGAALLGGAMGLTTPVPEGNVAAEKAKMAGLGAVTGGATQKLTNVVASKFGSNVARARSAASAPKGRILQEALDNGYVVPPSQAKPSVTNRFLEGWSGGGQTAKHAASKNQQVTNDLVKKALGVPDDLNGLQAVQAAQKRAGSMYERLRGLGNIDADSTFENGVKKAVSSYQKTKSAFRSSKNPDIDDLIDDLTKKSFDTDTVIDKIAELRREAGLNFRSMEGKKVSLARVQSKVANELEGLIDRNLQKTGKQQLLSDFRAGRQLYAKAMTADKALNPVTGDFSATKIGAELSKKRKPLTGELKQIAEFAEQFPDAAKTVRGSVLPINPLETSGLGALSVGTGHPGYLGWLIGRPAVRAGILSGPYQRGMTQPSGGLLSRTGQEVAADPTLQYLLRAIGPYAVTQQE